MDWGRFVATIPRASPEGHNPEGGSFQRAHKVIRYFIDLMQRLRHKYIASHRTASPIVTFPSHRIAPSRGQGNLNRIASHRRAQPKKESHPTAPRATENESHRISPST